MSIYPTELVAKAEFELRIFERVSQETGKQLLDEVKRLREALNQPAATPTLVGEVYRYGRGSKGAEWHGVHWKSSGIDLPSGTSLYTLNRGAP